nr:hypothetical protein CFP56_22394 [Quercus suber]
MFTLVTGIGLARHNAPSLIVPKLRSPVYSANASKLCCKCVLSLARIGAVRSNPGWDDRPHCRLCDVHCRSIFRSNLRSFISALPRVLSVLKHTCVQGFPDADSGGRCAHVIRTSTSLALRCLRIQQTVPFTLLRWYYIRLVRDATCISAEDSSVKVSTVRCFSVSDRHKAVYHPFQQYDDHRAKECECFSVMMVQMSRALVLPSIVEGRGSMHILCDDAAESTSCMTLRAHHEPFSFARLPNNRSSQTIPKLSYDDLDNYRREPSIFTSMDTKLCQRRKVDWVFLHKNHALGASSIGLHQPNDAFPHNHDITMTNRPQSSKKRPCLDVLRFRARGNPISEESPWSHTKSLSYRVHSKFELCSWEIGDAPSTALFEGNIQFDTMRLDGYTLASVLLVQRASAVDLTFATVFDIARSVIVANLESGEEVEFFSDAACQVESHIAMQDACFTISSGSFGSFRVFTTYQGTKELVPADQIKLTNYTGLAKTDPYAVSDALASIGVVGLAVAAVAVSPFVASAYSTIGGCYSAISGDALSKSYCVASIYATVIGIALPIIYAKYGEFIKKHFNGFNNGISNIDGRSILDAAHNDYMLGLMNLTHLEGRHIGAMERYSYRGESLVSPLFEIESGGVKWHLTAFMEPETGDIIHHVHLGSETANLQRTEGLEKRNPPSGADYQQVRWDSNSGGVDFGVCSYGAPYSGWDTTSTKQNYDTIWDQVTCQTTPDDLGNSKQTGVDVFNARQQVIGSPISPKACRTDTVPLNQDCFIS